MPDRPRPPMPLATRVVQLQHELAFDQAPTVTVDRTELATILQRYTAMSHALVRALHELDQVGRD